MHPKTARQPRSSLPWNGWPPCVLIYRTGKVPVRYIRTRGGQPFQGREDLGCLAVFGCIDNLRLLDQAVGALPGSSTVKVAL